jgi:diguanylate cyclase (GGDEF)-like protein
MAITLLGTHVAVWMTMRDDAMSRTNATLSEADALLQSLIRTRTDSLSKSVRTLAKDTDFRNALADQDHSAIAIALRRHARDINADFGIALDRNGSVITATRKFTTPDQSFPELVVRARDEHHQRSPLELNGGFYDVITVAIKDHEPVTWVAMGFAIDDTLINLVAARTDADISTFAVSPTLAATRLIGTTLENSSPEPVDSAPVEFDSAQSDARIVAIAGQDFLVRSHPLFPDSGRVMLLLQTPLYAATAPYRLLGVATLMLGALTLLVALVAGLVLSRVLIRPIRQFSAAARRIGAGDYSQPVPTDGPEEFSDLAAAMNQMQNHIAERDKRVSHQAKFDRLTGLPNRILAEEHLQEAIANTPGPDVPISIMLVDLCSFGDVGASFGPGIADALLIEAAECLCGIVDPGHTVARLEGDEFLIIMAGVEPEAAWETAEELLVLLDSGLSVKDVNICIDASIGICTFPRNGHETDQLLLRAAVAKNTARTTSERISIYEEGKEERQVRRLAILGDLRRAIRQEELKLYVQPKINLADRSICGAEALARWDHPTYGILPPSEFIPIAEKSGNISLITEWAVTTSIRECRLWCEEGLDLPVSVNLSGQDLMDPKLPGFITATLKDHDLDPRYLMLEITEQALVHDFDHATAVLEQLHDLGIRIAIDDFGTGHSSFAKIKHLPVDELKIDRSFVKKLPEDDKDIAIVEAAIGLAHSLGMEVLAEGVEERAAMEWLTEHGCERAQGFLISRPMPVEIFSQWVSHFDGEVATMVIAFSPRQSSG